MERPRESLSSPVSFVLVLERERDESPPIIELKDIFPNEPPEERDISWVLGKFEFERSKALSISCDACWSSSCGDAFEGVSVEEKRFDEGDLGEKEDESRVPERVEFKPEDAPGVGTGSKVETLEREPTGCSSFS